MDGLVALDVAIGLIFLFLLLSIIASGIGEWISRLLTLRAKTLRDGIRSLMAGEDSDLTKALYSFPAIRTLSKAVPTGDTDVNWWTRVKGPSAIPPSKYADALFDLLLSDNPQADAKNAMRTMRDRLDKPITGAPVATGTAVVDAKNVAIPPAVRERVRSIMNAVEREMVDGAKQYGEFRKRIERSFDESMDRVTGWYKRKMQVVLLIIGIALASALNINSFTVASDLWNDEEKRAVLVAEAENAESVLEVKEAEAKLDGLTLPIGWTTDLNDPRMPNTIGGWFLHLLGLLVTAAAVSFGAPFWFDLMNKLIDLRGGGKEGSKVREKDQVDMAPSTEHL